MAKAFYLHLAWSNIRRDRRTYLPHMVATAVISGVFLLIAGLLFSKSLNNLPTGSTATAIFAFGIVVFAIFALFFMVYINNFLISRRKKEFGLYGILGLEKRHVGRVLLWENLITLTMGMLLGVLISLVFGRLLFLLLLKLIHTTPESSFSIAPIAFALLAALFFAIFLITTLLNLRQVHLASPMQLMQSERRGEKESKLMVPAALLGLVALCAAYYFAWVTNVPGTALGLFFPLAILVVFATFTLFISGSVAFLKLLKKNKALYYRQENFIAISGMIQRMKQNGRSLAAVCILSTMLVVTISGTLALYLGQEDMLSAQYPFDVCVWIHTEERGTPAQTIVENTKAITEFESAVVALSKECGVTLSADRSKLIYEKPEENYSHPSNYVPEGATWVDLPNLICFDGGLRFDVDGTEEDCLAFISGIRQLYAERTDTISGFSLGDRFTARQDYYALYGGLLFLGAFFGLLFLAVTVLIIYFKQISEGYEDKAHFEIMQKVGMDDAQVRTTINRQVLWVFFIPLFMTALHMVFASKIMARMLQTFMLYDWMLVLACTGGVLILFALMYLVVYRLTAKVYYRIVKW